MDRCLYDVLEVGKDCTSQQIKQSYKKLALKHHPDKNVDKEDAKMKFREISEAYAILNDPGKRKNYDLYGIKGDELEGINFDDFADEFKLFEEFIDEFLGFDDFETMLSSIPTKKGKKKAGGRVKGKKGKADKDLMNLQKMMEAAMIEAMMDGGQFQMENILQFNEKDMKDFTNLLGGKQLLDSDQDEEDLTEEEILILKFGEQNIRKQKRGKKKKKTVFICKICGEEIPEDEILLHFSENHRKQFEQWKIKNG